MLPFFKKNINYLYVFLAYLVLAALFFIYPLTHKVLIADGDGFYSYFPLKMYYAGFLKNGIHLWLPYQFLGESFLGSLQTGILYPLNFMYLFMPISVVPYIFNFNLILHYALAGIFMYIYLKNMDLKPITSFIGGMVFAFAGFLMAHRGHISVMNAAIWLPLVIYFYEKIRSTLKIRYVALAAFAIAIQIFAGFFQVSLYTYIILSVYVFFFFISDQLYLKKNWMRYLIYFGLPVILGALLALPQLVSTLEMSKYSMRSGINYDFFTEFSMPPMTLLSMIVPFLFGGAYGIPHWASYQRAEMGAFIGIAPLLVAIVTPFVLSRKDKNVLFWSIIGIIGLFLSFGRYNPLYKIFYYLPVYNIFRVPARNIFEFDFALVILFSIGINSIIVDGKDGKNILNKLIFALGGIIFLIYVLSTIGKTFGYASAPTVGDFLGAGGLTLAGQILITKSKVLFVPFVFAFFYFAWALLYRKKIFAKKLLLVVFALVLFVESYSFGMVYDASWPKISDVKAYFGSGLTKFLTSNLGFDRVLFVNQQNPALLGTVEKINSLNGYDSLLNSNIHSLLDMVQNGASPSWQDLLNNNLILSSLGVKYVVIPKQSNLDLTKIVASNDNLQINYEKAALADNWITQNVSVNSNTYTLLSPDVNVLTIMEQPVSLKKNTDYLISVKAHKNKIDPMYPLIVGIYGGAIYDNAEQNFNIDNSLFTNEEGTFSKIINTGNGLPAENTFLRLYSYSRTPIVVDSVSLEEVKNFHIPYTGKVNVDMVSDDIPLYKKLYEDSDNTLYENTNNLSRAYFVRNVTASDNILDTKSKIISLLINPSDTAVLSTKDFLQIKNKTFTKGAIQVNKYDTDYIDLTAKIDKGQGFLVLADQYYPGWKAYVDGKETKIYEVNNLIRGVEVPIGKHIVTFKYQPNNVYFSSVLSLLVFSALFILVLRENI